MGWEVFFDIEILAFFPMLDQLPDQLGFSSPVMRFDRLLALASEASSIDLLQNQDCCPVSFGGQEIREFVQADSIGDVRNLW